MRKQILDLIDKTLKNYDLEGIEIVDEDLETIESLIIDGKSLEEATSIVLNNIRETLDEDLD